MKLKVWKITLTILINECRYDSFSGNNKLQYCVEQCPARMSRQASCDAGGRVVKFLEVF